MNLRFAIAEEWILYEATSHTCIRLSDTLICRLRIEPNYHQKKTYVSVTVRSILIFFVLFSHEQDVWISIFSENSKRKRCQSNDDGDKFYWRNWWNDYWYAACRTTANSRSEQTKKKIKKKNEKKPANNTQMQSKHSRRDGWRHAFVSVLPMWRCVACSPFSALTILRRTAYNTFEVWQSIWQKKEKNWFST